MTDKCQICGNDRISEGLVLKKNENLILCWDCWTLIHAVIKDNILEILGELDQPQLADLKGWTHPLVK